MLIPMVLPSGHLGKMLCYTSDAPATSEYYLCCTKENNLVKILIFSIPDLGIKKAPDLGSGYATLEYWISVMQPDPTDNR
jgi:hypothetical protein